MEKEEGSRLVQHRVMAGPMLLFEAQQHQKRATGFVKERFEQSCEGIHRFLCGRIEQADGVFAGLPEFFRIVCDGHQNLPTAGRCRHVTGRFHDFSSLSRGTGREVNARLDRLALMSGMTCSGVGIRE